MERAAPKEGLGFELRAYTFYWPFFHVFFFFKIGSCELFPWAGLELRSS
jgi:hypothetical protein